LNAFTFDYRELKIKVFKIICKSMAPPRNEAKLQQFPDIT